MGFIIIDTEVVFLKSKFQLSFCLSKPTLPWGLCGEELFGMFALCFCWSDGCFQTGSHCLVQAVLEFVVSAFVLFDSPIFTCVVSKCSQASLSQVVHSQILSFNFIIFSCRLKFHHLYSSQGHLSDIFNYSEHIIRT